MVDEPEAGNEKNGAEIKESSTTLITGPAKGGTPETGSQSTTENAEETKDYTQYVSRPFVALWRLVRWLFLRADKHNGGITALATIAIMALTGFYVSYSKKQWVTMQRQLELANSPSVGIDSLDVRYRGISKDGVVLNPNYFAQAIDMDFYVAIKNFGPVPAENYLASWKILVGGAEQPVDKRALPAPIFPGNFKKLAGHVGEKAYPDVVHGTKSLVLDITIHYEGPVANQHYEYCQREQFAPYLNGFIDLGPTCDHKTQ